jgi:hypothetical protein
MSKKTSTKGVKTKIPKICKIFDSNFFGAFFKLAPSHIDIFWEKMFGGTISNFANFDGKCTKKLSKNWLFFNIYHSLYDSQ